MRARGSARSRRVPRAWTSSRAATYPSARPGSPISSSMASTSSLAPPWRGPLRVAIAAVRAAWRSASVATATRTANVEALSSWSAWSVRIVSRTWATSGAGGRPWRSRRKWAACEPPVSAVTGSCPVRRRCQAATTPGIRAVRRNALRRFAASSPARPSGSTVAASETAVRRTSSGCASRGSARRRSRTGRGISRAVAQPASEGLALRGGRELPEPEEVGRLLEAGVGREVADLVPAVVEAPRGAVDGRDGRARRDHVLEPRLPGGLHGCPPSGCPMRW